LDQAVRNVVAWGFATAEQAIGMASTRPAALLGLKLAQAVEWDETLTPRTVTAGDVTVSNPARPTGHKSG
jgi:N-acetylglucosamine-6-phosphate deacetylase